MYKGKYKTHWPFLRRMGFVWNNRGLVSLIVQIQFKTFCLANNIISKRKKDYIVGYIAGLSKVTNLKLWFILNGFFFRFIAHTARRHIQHYIQRHESYELVYYWLIICFILIQKYNKNRSEFNVFDWLFIKFIKFKAQIVVSSFKFFLIHIRSRTFCIWSYNMKNVR